MQEGHGGQAGERQLCRHRVPLTSMVPFSRTSRHQWVGSARKGVGSRSAGGWLLLRASSLLGLKREPESP